MDAPAASSATAVPHVAGSSLLSEFPLEWAGLAIVAVIDTIWAKSSGFSFVVGLRDLAAVLGIFAIGLAFRTLYRDRRGSLIAEYCALSLAATGVLGVLSYLCCAISLPPVDSQLLRLDRMIGFDWQFWYRTVQSHPAVLTVMHWLYGSIASQDLYFFALFGILCGRTRLREMFWIFFVACLITFAVSIFLPALGPFETFKLNHFRYVDDVRRLHQGGNFRFSVEGLTGIVTFPSFHTTLAIIYTYVFRRTGVIGIAVAGLNLLMLPTIPFIGGQYLVDMFAGAAVAGIAIVTVRSWLPSNTSATHMSQQGRAALACNDVELGLPHHVSSQIRLPGDKQCGSYVTFRRRFRAVTEQWTPKWLSSR
jgi:hypothetical protein